MSTAASLPAGGAAYERRRPEETTLYRVVNENLRTLYRAAEEGFASAPLPAFVRQELEGYLDCGLLCRGFAHLACTGCNERRLVAFACKGRGFCPSCLGRRMAQTAANLVDHVVPAVPLRQFVLTLPFALRARLGFEGELLGQVCRLFVDGVLGWYRRRMEVAGVRHGQSGAVAVIQRTSADLKLNPHLHVVFLDGVFLPPPASEAGAQPPAPSFHPLPHLSSTAVADVLALVRRRILRLLVRRGVVELLEADPAAGEQLSLVDDGAPARDPALALLAAASAAGLPPAGPELRRRPVPLPARSDPRIERPLCVSDGGFGLHAATRAGAQDWRAREALFKYVLRPPVAHEHVQALPDGLVRIALKRPFRDGTVAVDMDGLSLLARLAAAVPPPRMHTVRYAGVLAPAAALRPTVVPAGQRSRRTSGARGPVFAGRAPGIDGGQGHPDGGTVPRSMMTTGQVLATYRLRWQVELAFKTLKTVLHFGALPNRLHDTGRTWLLAKLVCALLLERLAHRDIAFPPGAHADAAA